MITQFTTLVASGGFRRGGRRPPPFGRRTPSLTVLLIFDNGTVGGEERGRIKGRKGEIGEERTGNEGEGRGETDNLCKFLDSPLVTVNVLCYCFAMYVASKKCDESIGYVFAYSSSLRCSRFAPTSIFS